MIESWLYIFIISMMPWIELRGSIPVGIIKYGLNPVSVFIIAYIANIIIIVPAFWFLDLFFDLARKHSKIVQSFIDRTHRKARPYVEKYGMLGLTLFVGIPLPGTGAYSGALAAHIFGIKNKKAVLAIMAGVFIAGVVITLASTVFAETLGWLVKV